MKLRQNQLHFSGDYGYITIITISTISTTVEVPHIESASYLSLRRHQTPTYPCFFLHSSHTIICSETDPDHESHLEVVTRD